MLQAYIHLEQTNIAYQEAARAALYSGVNNIFKPLVVSRQKVLN